MDDFAVSGVYAVVVINSADPVDSDDIAFSKFRIGNRAFEIAALFALVFENLGCNNCRSKINRTFYSAKTTKI